MPTVYRYKGYRFFFYMADQYEPPHIHVEKEASAAKFWLAPVALSFTTGFNDRALREIERIVVQEYPRFIAAWRKTFGRLQ